GASWRRHDGLVTGSSACTDDESREHGQPTMKHVSIAFAVFLICTPAPAEESFNKEQIAAGGEIYAVNCAPCHGARMLDPGSAFNLRKFPPDQRERFVTAVTPGQKPKPARGGFSRTDTRPATAAKRRSNRAP